MIHGSTGARGVIAKSLFSDWPRRLNREQLVTALDWTIEYGIYLLVLMQFQSKGEAFRSIGMYAPLVAWLIKLCLVRDSGHRVSLGEIVFLVFTGSLLISALLSIDHLAALRGFRKTVLKAAILFFLISQNFTTWEKLKRLGWLLACSGCIAVVAGFLNYFSGYTVGGGMAAFSTHRNGFASILGYLIPFIIACTVTARVRVTKIFFGGFFVFSLVAMLLTISRGGWISLSTSLGIWGIFLLRSRARLVLQGAAVVGVVVLMTISASPRAIIIRMSNLQQDAFTLNKRVPERWIPALEAVKDRPLFGWGPAEVVAAQVFPTYYKKALGRDPEGPYIGMHSFYLTILFYGGFVALTIYLVFVSIFLVGLLRNLIKTVFWSERSVMIAVLSSFVAVYLVHGIVEGLLWWTPLGVILGFGEACSKTRSERDSDMQPL
jgi:O-antigen ligase